MSSSQTAWPSCCQSAIDLPPLTNNSSNAVLQPIRPWQLVASLSHSHTAFGHCHAASSHCYTTPTGPRHCPQGLSYNIKGLYGPLASCCTDISNDPCVREGLSKVPLQFASLESIRVGCPLFVCLEQLGLSQPV